MSDFFGPKLTWTDERTDVLKNRWADGISGGHIAAELGITRNAVIGKIHRLGLHRSMKAKAEAEAKTRRPRARTYSFSNDRVKALKTVKPPVAEPELKFNGSKQDCSHIPIVGRKTLLQLDHNHCRFPFGDVGDPDFFFCGAETVSPLPYCAYHCRIAYTIPTRGLSV
jgi:GcrA cell cycle regulator